MHGEDLPGNLARDGSGVGRGDRADGKQFDRDLAGMRRGRIDGNRALVAMAGLSRAVRGDGLVAKNQEEGEREERKQHEPDPAPALWTRKVRVRAGLPSGGKGGSGGLERGDGGLLFHACGF